MKNHAKTKQFLLVSSWSPLIVPMMLSSLVTASSCTRQVAYQSLLKDQVLSKSVVDTNSTYLYVPSTTQAQRTAAVARPNWMGEPKKVTISFNETDIVVTELEQDSRFAGNATNRKPVMTIPIEHHEYRCALNASQECSNKEEENTDLTWNQKSQFKMKTDGPKVAEVNTLPIDLENLYAQCYEEVDSKFVDYSFDGGAINLEVEKTYKAKPQCIEGDLDSLSDLSFLVRNHYSFAKAASLISADYQPVLYPDSDQSVFGFFTTVKQTLSVDYNDEESGQITYLNRWNAARKEIIYTMDASFNKPENADLKAGNYKAFEAINQGFAKAGIDLHFKLVEPNGALAGDIRSNMILNVEDPEDSGLLGYGPVIANPDTGEILNARVSMYSGNMKKYIKRAWDELVEERSGALSTAAVVPFIPNLSDSTDTDNAPSKIQALSQVPSQVSLQASLQASGRAGQAGSQALAMLKGMSLKTVANASSKQASAPSLRASGALGKSTLSQSVLKQIHRELTDYTAHSTKQANALTALTAAVTQQAQSSTQPDTDVSLIATPSDVLKKYGLYLAEEFDFEDAVSAQIDAQLTKNVPLKPWLQLTADQRDSVIKAVVPVVWVPVLIHELGHNMGLRHNFSGSEDKNNFYSKEELAAQGLTRAIPYSSVMDYGYKELNQLRALGKYDIAAFRFGYGRQVESKTGSLVTVPSTLSDVKVDTKPYMYCTDENVGINAGCRRFDQGTSFTEIAQNYVDNYNKYFDRRSLRNGSRSFSLVGAHGDLEAAARASNMMRELRLFYEVYERIQNKFGTMIKPEDWQNDPFLKDLDQATMIAQNFFLSVLVTPDLHCMLAKPEDIPADGSMIDPAKIVEIDPFVTLQNMTSSTGASCYELKMPEGIQVAAEGGRLFNSAKSAQSTNPFADQIDVRGIWPDKIAASKALFQRVLGNSTLDQYTGNFLDTHPGSAPQIMSVIQQIMSDQVSAKVPFRSKSGQVLVVPLTYSLFDSHKINQLLDQGAARAIGLPHGAVSFHSLVLNQIQRYMPDTLPNEFNDQMRDLFSLYSSIDGSGLTADQFDSVQIGSKVFFALKTRNGMALDLMHHFRVASALEAVDQDSIPQLLEASIKAHPQTQSVAESSPPAASATASTTSPAVSSGVSPAPDPVRAPQVKVLSATELALAQQLPPTDIAAFASGKFGASTTYEQLLELMRNASPQRR